MQGVSAAYIATQQTSHTAVVSAIVLTLDGKIIINLEPHAGSVTSDRTAAQLTTFEFEIIDRLGVLAPTSMTSLLAPFGALVQVFRGVRNKGADIQLVTYNQANPWTLETMNSVKINSFDGSLTLGP